MKNKVLIIVAHPDDEVLGCGASAFKHSQAGDEVKLLILSDGEGSRDQITNLSYKIKSREKATREAANILGIKEISFIGLKDNRLDSYDMLDIVKIIENNINIFKPDIIYTHHYGDLNIDHKIVNQAVITACRPIKKNNVKHILSFEILSSTEWQIGDPNKIFIPNYFVDISPYIDLKKEALKIYKDELMIWPHSRSIEVVEALAIYRGSQAGFKYAEAFCSLRNLIL